MYNECDEYNKIEIHKAFVNGDTINLMMDKYICWRSEQNEISNNNIMNAFSAGKYCIDIDFCDQLRCSRSITFKTDHNFVCGDMNSNEYY